MSFYRDFYIKARVKIREGLLVFGVKYTDIAVMGSKLGSRYNSVTSRSLSFIRKGNFCISTKLNIIKYQFYHSTELEVHCIIVTIDTAVDTKYLLNEVSFIRIDFTV